MPFMKCTPWWLVGVFCVFALAACRQPDGPMPSTDEDVPDRQTEIARDLLNVAGLDDPSVVGELRDDLVYFAEDSGDEAAQSAVQLATALSETLRGIELTEEDAMQLAEELWLVVAAQNYSEVQLASVQDEVRRQLTSIGIPEGDVQVVMDQVVATQTAVTLRERRWWEWF